MLNAQRVRVRAVVDGVDARRIAAGLAVMPDGWFDLLAGSKEEASRWRTSEWRASLPPTAGPG